MSFHVVAYAVLGSLGDSLARSWKGLYEDIRAAGMRVYPPAYASAVLLTSVIVGVAATILSLLVASLLPVDGFRIALAVIAFFLSSGLAFILGMSYPSLKKHLRSYKFDLEVPYLAAYVTTMATGGISPYISMERLAKAPKYLFEVIREEAAKFYLRVRALGEDPLTAIEELAKDVPNRAYRQLMLGYAATLRVGGDVVHYLQRQTEIMLRERVSQVKAIGERVSMLLEAYLAIALILALVIYVMNAVNFMLAQAGLGTTGSEAQLFLFGYLLLPMISGLFIYLADMMQPKYPVYDKTPYLVYLASSLPLILILFIGTTLPFLIGVEPSSIPALKPLTPFSEFTSNIRILLGLPRGFESGLGMALSLMVGTLPAVLADAYSSAKHGGVQYGITRFLRDMVEVRKTGLSPEKCIVNLRERDYGKFSPFLREISNQVGWGVPLSVIFDKFAKRVKNWVALITMFLLVESIEVGGGTPEILEALASYAEDLEQVEKEKRSALKPLMLVPYVGAVILVVVVLVIVGFMNYIVGLAGAAIGAASMISIFVPPVVLNCYLMGLVAGKVSAERVSAGFKHAVLLMLMSLAAMTLTPHIVKGLAVKL